MANKNSPIVIQEAGINKAPSMKKMRHSIKRTETLIPRTASRQREIELQSQGEMEEGGKRRPRHDINSGIQ